MAEPEPEPAVWADAARTPEATPAAVGEIGVWPRSAPLPSLLISDALTPLCIGAVLTPGAGEMVWALAWSCRIRFRASTHGSV